MDKKPSDFGNFMTNFDFQNPYINPKMRQTIQKKNSGLQAAALERSPKLERESVPERFSDLRSIEVDLTDVPKESSPKEGAFASENIAETVGQKKIKEPHKVSDM